MFSNTVRGSTPILVAGALATGLFAPAGAMAKSTSARFHSDLHHAHVALVGVRHSALRRHFGVMRRDMRRVRFDTRQAELNAQALGSVQGPAGEASALAQVANQYSANASTFTSLIDSSSPSVQAQMSASVTPSLVGAADAVSTIDELSGSLPTPSVDGTTAEFNGTISSDSAELSALSDLITSGDVTASVESNLVQAYTTDVGALDTAVAEYANTVPQMSASAQVTANEDLSNLEATLGADSANVQATVGGDASAISTVASEQLSNLDAVMQALVSEINTGIPVLNFSLNGSVTSLLGSLGLDVSAIL